ncbi:hypothetical protein GMOD_00002523 [Pyrenophora seminiperda CCB06]|uniref:Uncharacterized protein n=1 Tax=Pyrenophora seminiperda CCB06 TaxID=1302712 RepID=A0A3M7M2K7_9PLEO|nr:hypothetical protein GMOD_00002523 [Pyrenophora seminiperda CCB06]
MNVNLIVTISHQVKSGNTAANTVHLLAQSASAFYTSLNFYPTLLTSVSLSKGISILGLALPISSLFPQDSSSRSAIFYANGDNMKYEPSDSVKLLFRHAYCQGVKESFCDTSGISPHTEALL